MGIQTALTVCDCRHIIDEYDDEMIGDELCMAIAQAEAQLDVRFHVS